MKNLPAPVPPREAGYAAHANWLYDHGCLISKLPFHMRTAVSLYLIYGSSAVIEPDSFLFAIFSNDLLETFKRADRVNLDQIEAWADFMYNDIPVMARGSVSRVQAWINSQGLAGLARAHGLG